MGSEPDCRSESIGCVASGCECCELFVQGDLVPQGDSVNQLTWLPQYTERTYEQLLHEPYLKIEAIIVPLK